MGRLLDIARAYEPPAPRPSGWMRLSEFAGAGRIVRLWSEVLGREVVFASDNADPARLPEGISVYWARELIALMGEDGPISAEHLRRLHEAKTMFEGEVIP